MFTLDVTPDRAMDRKYLISSFQIFFKNEHEKLNNKPVNNKPVIYIIAGWVRVMNTLLY